jgi:hypothetical protein
VFATLLAAADIGQFGPGAVSNSPGISGAQLLGQQLQAYPGVLVDSAGNRVVWDNKTLTWRAINGADPITTANGAAKVAAQTKPNARIQARSPSTRKRSQPRRNTARAILAALSTEL